jgi:hypothetical protein
VEQNRITRDHVRFRKVTVRGASPVPCSIQSVRRELCCYFAARTFWSQPTTP